MIEDLKTEQGRQRYFESLNARHLVEECFAEFLRELFRGVAKGHSFGHALHCLHESMRIGVENDVGLVPSWERVLKEISAAALPLDARDEMNDRMSEIGRAVLRLMAERSATDSAAAGRESQRFTAMERLLETYARQRRR